VLQLPDWVPSEVGETEATASAVAEGGWEDYTSFVFFTFGLLHSLFAEALMVAGGCAAIQPVPNIVSEWQESWTNFIHVNFGKKLV
jgi:hypothetical protein